MESDNWLPILRFFDLLTLDDNILSEDHEGEQERVSIKNAEECVGNVRDVFDDLMNEMREGIINDDDHSCSHLTLGVSELSDTTSDVSN